MTIAQLPTHPPLTHRVEDIASMVAPDVVAHRAEAEAERKLPAVLLDALRVYVDNRLEQIFRDVHVAAQHGVLNPINYEPAGRLLLGVDPAVALF
jgi:hypothetical protein